MSDTDRHPFLSGLSKHRGAQPTCVVIFGASGDLAARKLLPALYNLAVDSLLPSDFHLIGFGRKPIPDAEFRRPCLNFDEDEHFAFKDDEVEFVAPVSPIHREASAA